MTEDLVAFLRARLDEDAELAMAATPGPWRHDEAKHWRTDTSWFEEAVFAGPTGEESTCVAGTGETDDQQSIRDAAHIARHDPARVLAEVEAKRQIVDLYAAALTTREDVRAQMRKVVNETDDEFWHLHQRESALMHTANTLLPIIRALALPYANHPEYLEDWRQQGTMEP